MPGCRSLAEARVEDDARSCGQQRRAGTRAVGDERGVMLGCGRQRVSEFFGTQGRQVTDKGRRAVLAPLLTRVRGAIAQGAVEAR